MPSKDPKAYAQSPKGRAARKRARERWLAKRNEEQPPQFDAVPLAQVIQTNWRAQ